MIFRFGLFYFFYFAVLGIYLPFFNLYCKDLDFSSKEIGIVSAIHPFARLVFPLLWAFFADRWGARHIFIRWAWFCSLATFILLFWADTFLLVAIILLLYSFFLVPVLPLWEASTLEWVERNKMNYGSIRLWGSFGFMIFTLIFGGLLDFFPNRLILYGILCLSVLNIFVILKGHEEAKFEKQLLSELITFLKNKDLWIFLACLSLMVFSHGTFYGFFSIYIRELGISKLMIGLLWTVGIICEICLMIFTSWTLRKVDPLLFLPICFIAAFLRWWINANFVSLPMLFLSQTLHGFSFGVFHVVCVTLTHRIFPNNMRSSGQSFYSSFSFGLGGVLGLVLNGYLYDLWGARKLFQLDAYIALLGLVLALILCFRKRLVSLD